MKKRIFSIMDTSRKKAGIAIICCALIVTVGTGFTFAAQAKQIEMSIEQLDRQLNGEAETLEDNRSMMSRFDEATGQTYYSWDDGKTWTPLTGEEYDTMFPSPVVEWWTYEEYEAWMTQEIEALQALVDDGIPDYYDEAGVLRELTQADVDEMAILYQSVLEEIKNGMMVSKTVDGSENSIISCDPKDIEMGRGGHEHTLAIHLDNGEEVVFGPYSTRAELLAEAKPYCEAQVTAGNMTQSEYDEILSKYEN